MVPPLCSFLREAPPFNNISSSLLPKIYENVKIEKYGQPPYEANPPPFYVYISF